MSDYLRLTEAPTWCISYPTCSVCCVDLEYDDDWMCPSCGTSWDSGSSDGDTGTLYGDWAGEPATGPEVTEDEAWRISHLKGDARAATLKRVREEEVRFRAAGIDRDLS
ncbi:MAG TPA: hypothetical protein VMV41_01585 [Cellulomonadaceae bacterium]|nr:hypothetical protein [Cellulomonadaceae bacterium]